MIKKFAEKISPEELQDRVMKAGTGWHHHCLPPTCDVNDTGKDIIVLETGLDTLYCESSKELKKELEEHAYQLSKSKKGKQKPVKHEVLDIIREYIKNDTKWHFHITMPHCLLSISDKYILILENDDTSKKQEWEFDEKPIELVRQIDDYYLGRK